MSDREELFNKLRILNTEQRNSNTENIDLASPSEIVNKIFEEDKKVTLAIEPRLAVIADAIDKIAERLKKGGRLFYVGAGTSGRLGVLDAAECPPTFGTPPEKVQGFIAGGKEAMFVAQEGYEDSEEEGDALIDSLNILPEDVIVGLAASGRTPFVHGALKKASEMNNLTIFITTVPAEQIDIETDILIDIDVGPEVIMGSTRMKSGTAQKMVLNMLSTGAMIRLGKIYENVMVDLMLTNKKLHERAKRIIMMFSDVDYNKAEELLENSGGHVKTALVMGKSNLSKEEAVELLDKYDGFVREALKSLES